eukprot:TRINITY_DN1573_c1_g1_i1.p1 TRINITY_DN1573_c1_g1~~TRINITY_DN1573_c1_g1_i1.p1  ORF type:complete len:282 (+),score=82.53 TRINITY_DN1573_c1_g1_i1:49-846(+)
MSLGSTPFTRLALYASAARFACPRRALVAAPSFPSTQRGNRAVSVRHNSSGSDGTQHIRVYTRTGDKGQSSLFNGERRSKEDVVFDALGNTDELNAHLGLAREHCVKLDGPLVERIEEIQSRLLDVGSAVATPLDSSSDKHIERAGFDAANVTRLEQWIDEMDGVLPPLRNFILPSGGVAASTLHVSRTVCRRAERSLVPLVRESRTPDAVLSYLNRLSDFLFVAARYVAMVEGKKEKVYKKERAKGQKDGPEKKATGEAAEKKP